MSIREDMPQPAAIGAGQPGAVGPAPPEAVIGRFARGARGARWVAYAGMPIFLALAALALYLWVTGQQLDSIERRQLNSEFVTDKLIEHIKLAAVSTAFVIAIAVPLGIVLTRPVLRRFTTPVIGLANVGQAVPSIGLLVLFAIAFGIGFKYAVIALVAYSILPVLRNTMVGLDQVDPAIIDAGRGMGMSKASVLARIEMPLAVPVIMAGIRTAVIINVGTATLATFVNAGGLGDPISNGIALDRTPVLITGSVLTGILALFIDWLAGVTEEIVRPRGL